MIQVADVLVDDEQRRSSSDMAGTYVHQFAVQDTVIYPADS